MPIPDCCGRQPVCCEGFYDLVQTINVIAATAVNNCIRPICGDIDSYVCHADPIGGGDYVASWLASITPLPAAAGKMFFAPKGRFTINTALCLSGYPMPKVTQGGISAIPSAEEHSSASYYTYGAAQAMYGAVSKALIAKPDAPLGACTVANIGMLLPQSPAHHSARWIFSVTADGPLS